MLNSSFVRRDVCTLSTGISHLCGSFWILLIAIFLPGLHLHSQEAAPLANPTTPTVVTATLREALDTTVSPCKDFDQYVNGGWRSMYRDRNLNIFIDVRLRTDVQLLRVLEAARASASTTSDPILRLLGTFYASCLVADSLPTLLPATTSGKRANTRELQCLVIVDQVLQPALGYAFVRQSISPPSAAKMRQWLTTVHAALRSQVNGLSWIDDSVKRQAVKVLDSMTIRVQLEPPPSDYGTLTLRATTYTENRAALAVWADSQAQQERRHQLSKQTLWDDIPHGIPYHLVARSFRTKHIIEVTPIFFLPPFFDLTAESAANYAVLGMVLGHEMWHVLTPFFHWIDSEEGKRRAAVLVENYTKFGDSGWSTVNEDFGDLGGLLAAYAAWLQHGRSKAVAQIEGFTPEQRFFLYYARTWRNTSRSSPDGVHSGARARVNGVLMQMPAFAKAYGCRDGDAMVLPDAKRAQIF